MLQHVLRSVKREFLNLILLRWQSTLHNRKAKVAYASFNLTRSHLLALRHELHTQSLMIVRCGMPWGIFVARGAEPYSAISRYFHFWT